MTEIRDTHLTADGRYELIADVLADCPDQADVDEYLASIGWHKAFGVGDPDGPLSIGVWRNTATAQHMVAVTGALEMSPFTVTDTFPEAMDLVARWSPAIHAACLATVVQELQVGTLSLDGLVERVAVRAKFGTERVDAVWRAQEDRRHELRSRNQSSSPRRSAAPLEEDTI